MEVLRSPNYNSGVPYIISGYIREYDIAKANINVLLAKGVISKETFDMLYASDRMTRQVYIGKLQKDNPGTADILKAGIKEAKEQFIIHNNLSESDILTIKNDALFILGKSPRITRFGNIEFVHKNTYTSFYKLGRLEIYYYYNKMDNRERIDIKGIKPDNLKLHDGYFLEFLKLVFCSAQIESLADTLDIITSFHEQFINRQLDIRYYRNLDSMCEYTFYSNMSAFSSFTASVLNQSSINDIDISVNINVIRDLYQIFSSLYLSKFK